MIRLLTIIQLLLCVACASAGSLVTLTITVTNSPTAGDTITVNGTTRTNVAAVATPANEILIGADAGAHATNLFNQFAAYGFTTLSLNRSGTNIVTLRGIVDQTISASASGTWATLALSTNTTTNLTIVRVPATSEPNQASATNIFSKVVESIGSHSTSSIPATATALANHANLTTSQTLSNKTLISPTVTGGTMSGVSGGVVDLDASGNVVVTGPMLAVSNTLPLIRIYDTDAPTNEKNWIIHALNGFLLIETENDDGSGGATAFEIERDEDSVTRVSFGSATMEVGSFYGVGEFKIPWVQNTSLANGGNAAIDLAGATHVKIKAGPTGVFSINGISGGEDGRVLVLYNTTTYAMTIANDSGVEPTPANRIYTNTGGDITTTGNGVVTLVYESGDARWIVTSFRD